MRIALRKRTTPRSSPSSQVSRWCPVTRTCARLPPQAANPSLTQPRVRFNPYSSPAHVALRRLPFTQQIRMGSMAWECKTLRTRVQVWDFRIRNATATPRHCARTSTFHPATIPTQAQTTSRTTWRGQVVQARLAVPPTAHPPTPFTPRISSTRSTGILPSSLANGLPARESSPLSSLRVIPRATVFTPISSMDGTPQPSSKSSRIVTAATTA